MGLLQPEAGLLFWMTLAFAVVFILLAKFGFPVILRSIDSRKEFIDSSLDAAREAERKLASLRAEGDAILEEAARERTELLREAAATREQLLREARRKADEERRASGFVAAARAKAEAEREAILQDARHQVALLSIAVTEKMLRAKLDDEQAQTRLAEAMLDEMERRKTQKEA